MDLVISLLNMVLLIIFILCVLNTIRHLYNFTSNLLSVSPEKFELSQKQLFWLGVSISTIITQLIRGITL